jgi:hypothetical protein
LQDGQPQSPSSLSIPPHWAWLLRTLQFSIRPMTDPTPPDLRAPENQVSILWLLVFCLLIGVLTYGFSLFNLNLAIDNEVAGFADDGTIAWLIQGRWGTFLLNRFLLPHPIIPVVPMAITIAGLATSYVLSTVTWRWPIDIAHYAAAPFAIAFPVLVHLSAFLNLAYTVAIGFSLSALAVYLASMDRPKLYILAIPLLSTAIAMYQPVILFPLVSFLAFAAARVPAAGITQTLRRLIIFCLVLATSLILYYAVWRLWLSVAGIKPSYVNDFVQLGALMASPLRILATSARSTWSVLSGSSEIYLEKRHIVGATVLLAAAVVVGDSWLARRNLGEFLMQVALIAAALLLPLMVVAIDLGFLPYRNLLGVPLGFAGLLFMALSARRLRLAHPVLVLLCALCFLGFADGANRLFYAQSLIVQADRDLANQIVDRIHVLGGLPESQPTMVDIVGAHSMANSPAIPKIRTSTLGTSFFEWDQGNPWRIAFFMRSMGYDLRPIAPPQRSALLDRIKAMPSWPANGSVQRIDGIFVVKFSDYSQAQRMRYGIGD